MPIVQIAGVRSAFGKMQWRRGLRAAIAVGVATLFCILMHRPIGWAALGALYVCLVDNGGPYRLRLNNISGVMLLGSLAVLLGTLANHGLALGLSITIVFFFSITLARVLSQPLAAAGVFVLICYIVAFGGAEHTFAAGAAGGLEFLLGGFWSAALALILWPVDPFKPARMAVASVYVSLLELTETLPATSTPEGLTHFNVLLAHTRLRIEAAQLGLAATPARMTARTLHARNLTVLTESADLLLARLLRFVELAETSSPQILPLLEGWLKAPLYALELALRQPPFDQASAFALEGSIAVDLHRSELLLEASLHAMEDLPSATKDHIVATLRDTLFNLEISFEALRAIWTGAESRQREAAHFRASVSGTPASIAGPALWLEPLRSNLTLRSVMFRYALRMSAVIAVDVVLMRFIHVTHGYWLAMTSLIVLRPFAGETVRRSIERVAGTVAGGILAAGFTAVFSTHAESLALVVLCSAGCVALYAVDYAWYCFFLTPAIVMLTLPRLHDWHLAAVRTEMTVLGAVISVLAMLLLWPERESLQLPRLLARGAAADAAYLRAMLAFWETASGRSREARSVSREARIDAERILLAPARRLCGLAVNDAEETLDHAMLEHSIPLNPRRASTAQLNSAALTFTTYLRRLTRTTTTLAAIGLDPSSSTVAADTIATFALRLDNLSTALNGTGVLLLDPNGSGKLTTQLPDSLAGDQLRRLESQVTILERTALDLMGLEIGR